MTHRPLHSVSKLYSAPRRFDLATMMAVTLAYALLFGAFRLAGIQATGVVLAAGFITCVGVSQAVLFRGKKPRLSSVLVGAVCLLGVYVVDIAIRDTLLAPDLAATLMWFAVLGAILGYFAGVAVGTVFLVSDVIRRASQRRTQE